MEFILQIFHIRFVGFFSRTFNMFKLKRLINQPCQDELGCRVDFLLEHCFKLEQEEMETVENVNKLLLQNVLPLHVASFFMGKTVRNQVMFCFGGVTLWPS